MMANCAFQLRRREMMYDEPTQKDWHHVKIVCESLTEKEKSLN
jgi:hypothetical protein